MDVKEFPLFILLFFIVSIVHQKAIFDKEKSTNKSEITQDLLFVNLLG